MIRETIVVPQSFEFLLSLLFGRKYYRNFMGEHTWGQWKKHIFKVINAIRKSILVNIDTADQSHKRRLVQLCDEAAKKLKHAQGKDQVNLVALEYLTRTTFELMGQTPNHWEYRTVNREEDWRLDHHRKAVYTQSAKQKACYILHLTNWVPYCDTFSEDEKRELDRKLWYGFRGDGDRFMQWFKRKYKDVYLELF